MNSFELKIITPESVLFDTTCLQVNLPGTEGRMGVLAGHMNLISLLEPGVVEVFSTSSNKITQFIITDGFAEINANQCVILVEKGIETTLIDVEEFKQKLDKCQQELDQANLAIEIEMLTNQIKFLQSAINNKLHL